MASWSAPAMAEGPAGRSIAGDQTEDEGASAGVQLTDDAPGRRRPGPWRGSAQADGLQQAGDRWEVSGSTEDMVQQDASPNDQ